MSFLDRALGFLAGKEGDNEQASRRDFLKAGTFAAFASSVASTLSGGNTAQAEDVDLLRPDALEPHLYVNDNVMVFDEVDDPDDPGEKVLNQLSGDWIFVESLDLNNATNVREGEWEDSTQDNFVKVLVMNTYSEETKELWITDPRPQKKPEAAGAMGHLLLRDDIMYLPPHAVISHGTRDAAAEVIAMDHARRPRRSGCRRVRTCSRGPCCARTMRRAGCGMSNFMWAYQWHLNNLALSRNFGFCNRQGVFIGPQACNGRGGIRTARIGRGFGGTGFNSGFRVNPVTRGGFGRGCNPFVR